MSVEENTTKKPYLVDYTKTEKNIWPHSIMNKRNYANSVCKICKPFIISNVARLNKGSPIDEVTAVRLVLWFPKLFHEGQNFDSRITNCADYFRPKNFEPYLSKLRARKSRTE